MTRQDSNLVVVIIVFIGLCIVYAATAFPISEMGTMCCDPVPQ